MKEILKDHMVYYKIKEYVEFKVADPKEPEQSGKTHMAYFRKKVAASKGGKSRKIKSSKNPTGAFFELRRTTTSKNF